MGTSGEVHYYNSFDQLTRRMVIVTSRANTYYTYNAQGIRTAKKTPDGLRTAFLLDGGNVVGEVQNNTVTQYYLRGINLIRREAGTATDYYLFNAHGDVVNLVNTAGVVTQSYDYDAFGVEQDPDPLDTNHFRYCGEYLDVETGRYYLRARYYDPLIGRFTQRDTHWNTANMIYGDNPQKINEREDKLGLKTYSYAPQITAIMQAGNLYVYGINNPVAYIDTTGQYIDVAARLTPEIIAAIVAAISVGVVVAQKAFTEASKLLSSLTEMSKKARQRVAEKIVEKISTVVASSGAPMPDPDDWNFKDEGKLRDHYKEQKDDFGKISKDEYLQKARDLINATGDDILTKTRANGDRIFYNCKTNEFAVVTKDGIIRTFFKPAAGIEYFLQQ